MRSARVLSVTRFRAVWLTGAALALVAGATGAADYPVKPVRFIVALAPGGGTDFVARVLAGRLSETWGQQVVVDNRPGAGSIIGAELVAKAVPDGYTLLLGTNSLLTQPSLFKNLPYDVTKDFAPVTLALRAPLLLTAHPSLGVANLKELIALARAKPGELSYASPALATTGHLGGELFKLVAKVDIVHVPFKGAGIAIASLLAGEVKLMYSSPPAVVMHVKAGRLKALGVTGSKRAAQAPEIPTFEESGVRDFRVTNWYGMLAPAGTPRPVVARVNAELNKVLASGPASQTLRNRGLEPAPVAPEAFRRFLSAELVRWSKAVKDYNVKAAE